MRPSQTAYALGVAAWLASAGNILASPPTGVFLWYPEQGTPTSRNCDDAVARIGPSLDKAEAWFWGRAPLGSELEFYLFLTEDRMETTFSAEGDYDTGTLRLGDTIGDETTFEIVPDDHPTITIYGSIVAPQGGTVVTVILRDVPSTNSPADRVAHYCRFDEETEV